MVMEIEGHRLKGAADIDGTSVIFPDLNVVFGMGVTSHALNHDGDLVILITGSNPEYLAGLCKYAVNRQEAGKITPVTVIVPIDMRYTIGELLQWARETHSLALSVNLVGLTVGEDFQLKEGLIVRGFRTTRVSKGKSGLGYIIYSAESSNVETTKPVMLPEIAFTGRTKSEFIIDPGNTDVLRAKILLIECERADNNVAVADVRSDEGIHFSEILSHAHHFENNAIVLHNNSCRLGEFEAALSVLPSTLAGRVYVLPDTF